MTVEIRSEEDVIIATLGRGPQSSISGYGETLPEALRDLAAAINLDRSPSPEQAAVSLRPIRVK